ncbi:hypothetical protein B0H11DRAFT_1909154 [Mycena galericulata]|nr:hypothetical protein B0H11DRAFT_1909154 [Mycena galericulata]
MKLPDHTRLGFPSRENDPRFSYPPCTRLPVEPASIARDHRGPASVVVRRRVLESSSFADSMHSDSVEDSARSSIARGSTVKWPLDTSVEQHTRRPTNWADLYLAALSQCGRDHYPRTCNDSCRIVALHYLGFHSYEEISYILAVTRDYPFSQSPKRFEKADCQVERIVGDGRTALNAVGKQPTTQSLPPAIVTPGCTSRDNSPGRSPSAPGSSFWKSPSFSGDSGRPKTPNPCQSVPIDNAVKTAQSCVKQSAERAKPWARDIGESTRCAASPSSTLPSQTRHVDFADSSSALPVSRHSSPSRYNRGPATMSSSSSPSSGLSSGSFSVSSRSARVAAAFRPSRVSPPAASGNSPSESPGSPASSANSGERPLSSSCIAEPPESPEAPLPLAAPLESPDLSSPLARRARSVPVSPSAPFLDQGCDCTWASKYPISIPRTTSRVGSAATPSLPSSRSDPRYHSPPSSPLACAPLASATEVTPCSTTGSPWPSAPPLSAPLPSPLAVAPGLAPLAAASVPLPQRAPSDMAVERSSALYAPPLPSPLFGSRRGALPPELLPTPISVQRAPARPCSDRRVEHLAHRACLRRCAHASSIAPPQSSFSSRCTSMDRVRGNGKDPPWRAQAHPNSSFLARGSYSVFRNSPSARSALVLTA